jgi:phytoene synthase
MIPPAGTVEQIVRRSRSNLALVLTSLPADRRDDMRLFYAFCRMVDDLADDGNAPPEARRAALDRWSAVVSSNAPAPLQPMEQAIADLMARRGIPAPEMREIIEGVAMDLTKSRYGCWDELRRYCHGVASAVGLVSIRIFGCTQAQSRDYAEHLGYALQITNILRDVRQDWEQHGRIYLPADEMERFGVSEAVIARMQTTPAMKSLLAFLADRAWEHFASARRSLTPEDAPKLAAAEMMREVYSRILRKMQSDGFRVFDKRYRLGGCRKAWIALRALWQGLRRRGKE